MKISILDVAKLARVSRMTVSRVIGSPDSVAENTRFRVMQAIKELGYVPSSSARAMRSKDGLLANESLCIALIFSADTQMADGFFSAVAKAAEKEAAGHGLSVLQSHWQESFEKTWPRLKSLFAVSGICGTVLAGQFSLEEITAIQKFTPNIVLLDSPVPDGANISSVESDNFQGSLEAIRHLSDRGVKRLLLLTCPNEDHYFARATVAGVESLSNRFDRYQVIYTDMAPSSGYELIRGIFEKGANFDGVFCNDELAIGVMRAFSELKIKVPEQVKVVGFDDITHSAFLVPSLTTVSIDKAQLGREAVKTLVEIVKGGEGLGNMKKVIKARLVIRESA
ncbi:MAG: LacI family DNA-binding transcriptional regulator [Sedimentisphaerales bacterium]